MLPSQDQQRNLGQEPLSVPLGAGNLNLCCGELWKHQPRFVSGAGPDIPFSSSLSPSLQQHNVARSLFPKGGLAGLSASEIRSCFERRNPQFDPCSIERPFVPLQSSPLCTGPAAGGGKLGRKHGLILLLTIGSSSVLWCLHCPKVFECKAHA